MIKFGDFKNYIAAEYKVDGKECSLRVMSVGHLSKDEIEKIKEDYEFLGYNIVLSTDNNIMIAFKCEEFL